MLFKLEDWLSCARCRQSSGPTRKGTVGVRANAGPVGPVLGREPTETRTALAAPGGWRRGTALPHNSRHGLDRSPPRLSAALSRPARPAESTREQRGPAGPRTKPGYTNRPPLWAWALTAQRARRPRRPNRPSPEPASCGPS